MWYKRSRLLTQIARPSRYMSRTKVRRPGNSTSMTNASYARFAAVKTALRWLSHMNIRAASSGVTSTPVQSPCTTLW